MQLIINGHVFQVDGEGDSLVVNGTRYGVRMVRRGDIFTVYVNERPLAVHMPEGSVDGMVQVIVDAKVYEVEVKSTAGGVTDRKGPPVPTNLAADPETVTSQMTGLVVRVDVEVGDHLGVGDVLLTVESMKMENEVLSPREGVVKEVAVTGGTRVKDGDVLVRFEKSPGPAEAGT